jgi:hypothetical protein
VTEEYVLVLTPAEAASGTIKVVAIGGRPPDASSQTVTVRIPPVGDGALIRVAGLFHVRIQVRESVPASRWHVAAVALLNLNGLGLGYVLMRRWRAAMIAWIATGIMLLIALPVSATTIPIAAVVLYLMIVAFTAVHAAIRASRETPPRPQRPRAATAFAGLLLAIPVGSVPLYNHAHANALDHALLARLTAADHTMAVNAGVPFAVAQPSYDAVLATYRDLLVNHRQSRAAKQVPARLAAFYPAVASSPAAGNSCTATTPLIYLHDMPGIIPLSDLGSLATWPDARLATVQFRCGEDLYKMGDFAGAKATMQAFETAYPSDPNAVLAGKFVIAAKIASSNAEAGKQLPTLASGGNVTITISNDSPNAVHISYTGPATGTVDIAACPNCSAYNPGAIGVFGGSGPCSKAAASYPQATINVPPGAIYVLDESTDTHASTPPVDVEHTTDGGTYSICAYEMQSWGF